MMNDVSLVGHCPDCDFNLDGGGNEDCETCAAEPAFVTVVEAVDRDIVVVIIAFDSGRDLKDNRILNYLVDRWPNHRPLAVQMDGSVITVTDAGFVAILDLNIGG